MLNPVYKSLVAVGLGLAAIAMAFAQPPGPPRRAVPTNGLPSGITWYGVLEDGLAVAAKTERPIFLLSAAPQCAGVPGMW